MGTDRLAARLRELRSEADRIGWPEGAAALRRAEQSIAAGHLKGLSPYSRKARKALGRMAAAAVDARSAADYASGVLAGRTAYTVEEALAALPADPTAAATCARVGEVRFATWDEIDLGERLWVVPADRTKTQREYRIPLSSMALDVLSEAEDIRDATGLLFPSVRGLVMHDGTLTNLLKKLDIGGTTHGLRSSFRDWAAETGVDDKVAEMCLAHVNTDCTEAAYRRTDMIEARREALQRWADYLAG